MSTSLNFGGKLTASDFPDTTDEDWGENPAPPEPKPPVSPLRQSQFLLQQFFPALMSLAVDFQDLEAEAFFRYLEHLVRESGNPTDPIERMMIEQIALAHFRIALLHSYAAGTADKDVVEVYTGSAVRLTGEFRRLVLALREYRDPAATTRKERSEDRSRAREQIPKPVPSPAAPIDDDGQTPQGIGINHRDTEQGSNVGPSAESKTAAKPTTSGGRTPQSNAAWTDYGGGTRTPAPFSPAQPSVAKVNGATNGRGKGKGGLERRKKTKGGEVREAVASRVG